MISLRAAESKDVEYLQTFGLAPSRGMLEAGIRSGTCQIILVQEKPIGFLAFSVLWGTLPFLEFIEISEAERGQDYGTMAVRKWEGDMAGLGFDLVLTSTGADADAQHFWRNIGYVDCGALTVRNKAAEVFFQRKVAS